jgi:DNA-directed RNA polymerase I and III subunit RPAC1
VVLLKEFEGKHAEELVKVCPKKVFDIEDMGQGEVKAFPSFLQMSLLAFE